jgi:plastocyanin
VGADGVPLVAFYEGAGGEGADAETPLVGAAILTEGGWEVETAAEGSPGEPASTAIGLAGDTPVVAYGSEGRTLLARRSTDIWESEEADADGGLGVSMSIDADGNPHLAYYASSGEVRHAHSIDGGPWEVSDVGEGASGNAVTSIAVDAEGVHHIAWQTAEGVAYATNADGSFAQQEVPAEASSGEAPRVAAGTEGVLYLAWYDPEDTEVQLGVRGGGEPLLAVPAPPPSSPSATPTPTETGPPPCEPSGSDLAIAALDVAFDTDCLAAPAGEPFTINFDNQDTLPHNVAIYTEQGGEQLFSGEIITGPATMAYEVPALDPGVYFFQCDVHPNMTGTFVVA